MQWIQWMQWNSGIWWWEHCLWCKKVKPVDVIDAVCSGCSIQWTQYTVDIVDAVNSGCSKQWTQYLHSGRSGCSGIMMYGGGDILFGAKRSNQWMQYAVDAVNSGNSIYTVDAVDAVE